MWCGNGGTFNTMGLNDPKDSAPEAFFKKLDKVEFAKKYQVELVSTNPDEGRKFWTADEFHIEGSTVVRDFNGLKARYVGTVQARPDGKPQSLSAATIPKFMYQVKQFNRVSTLIFYKDEPVFLLDDPDGTTWIMKAYSTNVDPTLTYEALPELDDRLKSLPEGWKFRTMILDRDLILKANGAQRIMWDELGNAWDALEPEFVNFMPAAAAPQVLNDGENAQKKGVDGLHLTRYIEMFLATRSPDSGEVVAACYNSMFTSSGVPASRDTAPQQLVEGLDFDKLKEEYQILGASLNGPKLWTPDWSEFDAGVERSFNGIPATWVAQLNMGVDGASGVEDSAPYEPVTIARESGIGWNKGTRVLLIDDSDGNTWIMKGYQLGLEPKHSYEEFMSKGAAMFTTLPQGWKVRIKTLEKDLIERPEKGVATVMPDEHFNVYDKTGPGMTNYKP